MSPGHTVSLLLYKAMKHDRLAMARIHYPLKEQLDVTLGTLDHYFNRNSTKEAEK